MRYVSEILSLPLDLPDYLLAHAADVLLTVHSDGVGSKEMLDKLVWRAGRV